MRRFFDTNVLVYAYDARDAAKQELARAAIEEATADGEFIIGAQVTLPIYIYTQIKFGITPAINAVATLLITASIGIAALGLIIPRLARMPVRYARSRRAQKMQRVAPAARNPV